MFNLFFSYLRQFNDRIAIPSKGVRDQLIKWCQQPTKSIELLKLKQSLQPFYEIYDVLLWCLECFPVRLPKEIKKFFVVLARPSPICSLIYLSEEMFRLMDRLFEENIKRDVAYMEQLHMFSPIFYDILTSIFEPRLPIVWKPLIKYLITKSLVPFNQSRALADTPLQDEDPLDFFPNLPPKRGRGKYELDANSAAERVCNTFYRGHPKLTPGIFTVFCPHGMINLICFAFYFKYREPSPFVFSDIHFGFDLFDITTVFEPYTFCVKLVYLANK